MSSIGPTPASLPHLAQAEARSKSMRDDVVDPLRKTVVVAGATAVDPTTWRSAVGSVRNSDSAETLAQGHLTPGLTGVAQGLGVTGSALGGVMGVAQLFKGAKEANPTMMLSGATEITVSTATLAALGVVPGAAALVPVGAGLLGLRSLHDVGVKSRADRIDGWRDMVTAASMSSAVMHAPMALVAGLGTAAMGFNLVRGLDRIKQGHEHHNSFQLAQGTGALLAAGGAGLLCSGLALVPGVGLLLAGVAIPLLEQLKATRAPVDRFTHALEPVLYPAAVKAEKAAEALHQVAAPVTTPIHHAAEEVWNSAPLQPVRQAGAKVANQAARVASRALDRFSRTKTAQVVDEAFGKLTEGAPVVAPSATPPS